MDDLVPSPSRVPDTLVDGSSPLGPPQDTSYRAMLQRNNPNLNFSARVNPIWEENDHLDSEDDEQILEDDPTCPMIYTSLQRKDACSEGRGEMH